MRSYPGVAMEDLEKIKQEFRAIAFTCRLWSCPRATVGFDSEQLLLKHETSHRRILCDVSDCQYPPSPSVRSLTDHKSKCHSDADEFKRRRIRTSSNRIPGPSLQGVSTPIMDRGLATRPHNQREELWRGTDRDFILFRKHEALIEQGNPKRLEQRPGDQSQGFSQVTVLESSETSGFLPPTLEPARPLHKSDDQEAAPRPVPVACAARTLMAGGRRSTRMLLSERGQRLTRTIHQSPRPLTAF